MSINIYIQLQSVQAQSFFFRYRDNGGCLKAGEDTLFLISSYSGGRIDFTAGSLLRISKRIHCVKIIWLRVFLLWRCGSSATYLWLISLFSLCFASLMWASLALAGLNASLSRDPKVSLFFMALRLSSSSRLPGGGMILLSLWSRHHKHICSK